MILDWEGWPRGKATDTPFSKDVTIIKPSKSRIRTRALIGKSPSMFLTARASGRCPASEGSYGKSLARKSTRCCLQGNFHHVWSRATDTRVTHWDALAHAVHWAWIKKSRRASTLHWAQSVLSSTARNTLAALAYFWSMSDWKECNTAHTGTSLQSPARGVLVWPCVDASRPPFTALGMCWCLHPSR